MNKEQQIKETERIVTSLRYHLQKYREYKIKSQTSSRQKDKSNANNNMITHADAIEHELSNSLVYGVISTGGQFQFEDFWRYVESDVPNYISIIETHLETLKSEN